MFEKDFLEANKNFNTETNSEQIMHAALLKSLLYFDLFQYPLTRYEIIQFTPYALEHKSLVDQALIYLKEHNIIFQFGEFYSLQNNESLIQRRINGNKLAENILPKALKMSRFISSFPFVRCVGLSGSLSKDYFDERSDFDYFIIAEPGRLWLCRALLVLYKKIFLFNSRKYFCINYFIDSNNLEIPDKNIFTATEVVTLKKQVNNELFSEFIAANEWVKHYLPNFECHQQRLIENNHNKKIKKIIEKIFSGNFGNWLDTRAMQFHLNYWKKKFRHLQQKEFDVNLRSQKHVSKHHPQGFQFKVLNAFAERCREFEQQHHLKIL